MTNVVDHSSMAGPYDLVVAGSGFGSLFFLHRLLAKRPSTRVLILEAGGLLTHEEQLALGANERRPDGSAAEISDHVHIPDGHKPWRFTDRSGGRHKSAGGARACASIPTTSAPKASMASREDWPLSYDDLETLLLRCRRHSAASQATATNTGPFARSRGPIRCRPFCPTDVRCRPARAECRKPANRHSRRTPKHPNRRTRPMLRFRQLPALPERRQVYGAQQPANLCSRTRRSAS